MRRTGEIGITLGTRCLDHRATSGYLDTVAGLPDAQPTMIDTFPGTTSWWEKINLTWNPDSDQLYYAQFAQVERPGRTNYAALDASCPEEYAGRVQEYYPGDQMTSWEAGAKLGVARRSTPTPITRGGRTRRPITGRCAATASTITSTTPARSSSTGSSSMRRCA